MIHNEEFKEYSIKDVWKLRKQLLLISPTGKIYLFYPDNFEEKVLLFLKKRNIDLEEIIDKFCEDFYQRGIEIEIDNLKDFKYIIINFFGFVIYDYHSSIVEYPKENYIYKSLTEIQIKILSKLYKKNVENLFLKKGEDTHETTKDSFKNLCYNKRKITKKRFS